MHIKQFRRILFLVMVVVMLLGSASVFAEEEMVPYLVKSYDEPGQATDAKRLEELPTLRDATSKTYLMDDGSFQSVVNSESIHYLDKAGDYMDIDNRIVEDSFKDFASQYQYRNAANAYTSWFGHMDDPFPVLVQIHGHKLAFALAGATASKARPGTSSDAKELNGWIESSSSIIYEDVYPNIDVAYQTTANGLKEYFVVKGPIDSNSFSFNVKMEGMKAVNTKEGVRFVDEEDETIFEMGTLFAIDANDAYTDAVRCTLEGDEKLVLSIDEEYLHSPERVYPILIDPTLLISSSQTADTYLYEGSRYSNYYTHASLRTGVDPSGYRNRTLIKFNLPLGITGSAVTSSYLNIKYDYGATPYMRAYRVTQSWSSSGATWSNQPSYSSSDSSASSYHYSNNWYRMDVTSMVKGWFNGSYSQYGFMLVPNNEINDWRYSVYYSSDAASPNKPELYINYNSSVSVRNVYVDVLTTQSWSNRFGSASSGPYYDMFNAVNSSFINQFGINFIPTFRGGVSGTSSEIRDYCTYQYPGTGLTIPHDDDRTCYSLSCGGAFSAFGYWHCHRRNSHLAVLEFIQFHRPLSGGSPDIQFVFFGNAACLNNNIASGVAVINSAYGCIFYRNTTNTDTFFKRVLQHELGHLFGLSDTSCTPGTKCVMKQSYDDDPDFTKYDVWCPNCIAVFNRNTAFAWNPPNV